MKVMDNKQTEKLAQLKKSTEDAKQYFNENARRYEKFMNFVFKSSLNDNDKATLEDKGMPTLEFNFLEAFLSKQRGEFAKNQPSVTVRAADGIRPELYDENFLETIKIIEAHMRYVLFDVTNDMMQYHIFSDTMGGGYSVLKVFTDYINSKSFDQYIGMEKGNPMLCAFDPLAKKSHKGDGRFCCEVCYYSKDAFIEEYGKDTYDKIKFTNSVGSFSWAYRDGEQEVILVAEYHEKQLKKTKIHKLSNGHSVTEKEYKRLITEWEEAQHIEQPPMIIKTRQTTLESIKRYRFCDACILDEKDTDFDDLPLIFVDGNSAMLSGDGCFYQFTKPFLYHAMGIQRLKNFSGQSLANEIENTIQTKFIAAIESVPTDYLDQYVDGLQKPGTLLYNHFLDTNNPNVTLPPPREVMRQPIPPEISQTFRMTDEMTQTILGSYDQSAAMNSAKMSGIAFARSNMQSNMSVMPYIISYTAALNRAASSYVKLLPKYIRTPRTLPILLPSGKRSYVEINKKGSIYMKDIDPNALHVEVELGVNFALQKEISLQTIATLSQSFPEFAQFFGQYGLQTILDNIDIRGSEELKENAIKFQQQQQQQQQQAQQQQAQQAQQQQQVQSMQMAKLQKEVQSPTKEQVDLMEMQEKSKADTAEIQIKARDSETKFLEVMSKIRNADVENELKVAEIQAENTRSSVDAMIKVNEHIQEMSEPKGD